MAGADRPGCIRLIAGLGNPGKEYERTRHNAGFWLVERFALQSGLTAIRRVVFVMVVVSCIALALKS